MTDSGTATDVVIGRLFLSVVYNPFPDAGRVATLELIDHMLRTIKLAPFDPAALQFAVTTIVKTG